MHFLNGQDGPYTSDSSDIGVVALSIAGKPEAIDGAWSSSLLPLIKSSQRRGNRKDSHGHTLHMFSAVYFTEVCRTQFGTALDSREPIGAHPCFAGRGLGSGSSRV